MIADPQVRYMGTLGGNVANGDPGNDMPAVMMALGAAYRLEGPDGSRDVAATDFYQGAYFTALEPGEIPDRRFDPGAAFRSAMPTRSANARSATTRRAPPP